jgi:hypothetical protein
MLTGMLKEDTEREMSSLLWRITTGDSPYHTICADHFTLEGVAGLCRQWEFS